MNAYDVKKLKELMTRREYLAVLMRQRPELLRASMAAPSRYMTRTHVLLHAVALRRMGCF